MFSNGLQKRTFFNYILNVYHLTLVITTPHYFFMNKYLLLRDNKQSGPFTVPEIISFGIKPYDLVWLEGKSAAWRYPSEVEELKSYAPAVEEQPFDRFYKTREAIINQSPYEPKPIEKPVVSNKKVYINFPVAPKTEVKMMPAATVPTFTERTPELTRPAERLSVTPNNAPEKKYFAYAAIGACVLLLGFITVLLVNNNNQKEKLQELNTIVKEIQNKNSTGVPATQVVNEEPAPPASSETIINPELLQMSETENAAVAPVKPVITPTQAVVKIPAKISPSTEGEGRPVLRRTDVAEAKTSTSENNSSPAVTAAPTDNLFKQVNIVPGHYKVGMLGGISNLTLALTNNSQRELHKVVVEIRFLGPEKKIVNTQTVYFENVAPGAQSTIDVPKSKRGVSIDYTITDIKS